MPNNPNKLPIIYVEHDVDDQILFKQALTSLSINNPTRFFSTGQEVLNYLRTTQEQPLVILCDVKMPNMNGFELRDQIEADEYLKLKAVPFVFFSTWANRDLVNKAYKSSVQGYHRKGTNFDSLKQELSLIITYWTNCLHPNSF
jgi:CheY-like chemotaxis protein